MTDVFEVIKKIPVQPQCQNSLHDQLRALRFAAGKLGLYDAADFLRAVLESTRKMK